MPRLVAISKKHPVEKVTWAYKQGIRHFGENYVSHRMKMMVMYYSVYGLVFAYLETGARVTFQGHSHSGRVSLAQ